MDPRIEMLFFTLHSDNPREAPGTPACTRRAAAMVENLPSHPLILDVGCGPGEQTRVLADRFGGRVVALDRYRQYLVQLRTALHPSREQNRVFLLQGDMGALPFPPKTFDLIWSEGAIYVIGYEKGLSGWRDLLAPGGWLVVSEINWLQDDPPDRLAAYWEEAGVVMRTIEENLETAFRLGYEPKGHFPLPPEAWTHGYYTHLEGKISALEADCADDPDAMAMLQAERDEIDMYRRYGDWYGYVFYILRKVRRRS